MTHSKKTDLLTIRKTVERCRDEGIPLPEKALRRLVKNGDIPAIKSGNKSLLYFPNVLKFIECGNNSPSDLSDKDFLNSS